MFIHDLWTDYTKYLRKWVEKIRNFNAEEEPAEDLDAYQEFMDYYIGKTRRESIDPTVLPDGEKMSIVRRCTWLAEYIDRAGDGDPHGLLWQIMGDIKTLSVFSRSWMSGISRWTHAPYRWSIWRDRSIGKCLMSSLNAWSSIVRMMQVFLQSVFFHTSLQTQHREYQYARFLVAGGLFEAFVFRQG